MKPIFNSELIKLVFLPLVFLMLFNACQQEEMEVTVLEEEELVAANSSLANLLRRTAVNDGSNDDILDYASCLEVELPVTIVINDLEIIIDSVSDFETIEAIFNEFDNDNDQLEIVFPVTIILSDYTEVIIENQDALNLLVDSCSDQNETEIGIECIDFQYPIAVSIYNSNFQLSETIVVYNDEALYNFIDNLEGSTLASLNFPLNLLHVNGTLITVNNNTELELALQEAQEDCNQNNNQETFECFENFTIEACEFDATNPLMDAVFNLVEGTIGTLNCNADYNYNFYSTIIDAQNQTNVITLPETYYSQAGAVYLRVENNLGQYQIFTVNLVVSNCGATNCSELDVDAYLMECLWNVVNYNGSNDYIYWNLDFQSNGIVKIINSTQIIEATWSTLQTNNGVLVSFTGVSASNIQVISGSWLIVECEYNRLQMIQNQSTMVIEQDCSSNGICTQTQVENNLMDCEWTITNYNNDTGFNVFNIDFQNNNQAVFFTPNGNEEYTANWAVSLDGEIYLDFSNISGGNVQILNGNYILVECTPNQMIFHDQSNTNIELVLDKDCN